MPVVAFGTKAVLSGSAPRNVERCRRACPSRSGRLAVNHRSGFVSISSRRCCWARWTGTGTAPNDPWLRWAVAGSSVKSRRAPGIVSGGEVTMPILDRQL